MKPQPRLILASASPRRRQLLASLGVEFEVLPADVTENEDPTGDPKAMVSHNAALKADWISTRHPEAFVLGADTTVFIERTVLNKPRDRSAAQAMLRLLSGKTHQVFTGLALRRKATDFRLDTGETNDVTFKRLDEATINEYLDRVNVYDKAGGYGIQDHGELLVERYTGSLTNIVGLPVELTKQILTQCGLLG